MMDMRREFIASFVSYVNDAGDMRKRMLRAIVESALFDIVKQRSTIPTRFDVIRDLFEDLSYNKVFHEVFPLPEDLAALMTCAAYVDPNSLVAKNLLSDYEAYEQACQEAENRSEDPEKIVFNPNFGDLEIVLNPDLSELKTFVDMFCVNEHGRAYLGKVLTCLIWAHGIQRMIPSLYKPKTGGIKCSRKS